MPKEQLRYKPWPMKTGEATGRPNIDKDLVKKQYMESRHFEWKLFCAEWQYDGRHQARLNFPIRSWREEKLSLQVEVGDEELTAPAYEARMKILRRRLEFPETWNKSALNTLALVNVIENELLGQLKHDLENADAIKAGTVQKKCRPELTELQKIANIKRTLQGIHLQSLLLPTADAYKASIPIKDADPTTNAAEAEGQRLQEMEWECKAFGSVTQNEITHLLDNWIDQHKSGHGALQDAETAEEKNEALEPLDEIEG